MTAADGFSIFASDFHLKPAEPAEIEVFVQFTRRVVHGARRFLVLGDLFEYWIGPHQLTDAAYAPVFQAFRELAAAGTEVILFHGNRDFLLGAAEARAAGGVVVGEERAYECHGKRVLAMHGDSLCTRDVDYQQSKRILRSRAIYGLSRVMPGTVAHAIARRLRRKSTANVARKTAFTMGIVEDEVKRRLAEGFDAIVCGHVHRPEERSIALPDRTAKLYVLGDWHAGGIYGRMDSAGLRLARFEA